MGVHYKQGKRRNVSINSCRQVNKLVAVRQQVHQLSPLHKGTAAESQRLLRLRTIYCCLHMHILSGMFYAIQPVTYHNNTCVLRQGKLLGKMDILRRCYCCIIVIVVVRLNISGSTKTIVIVLPLLNLLIGFEQLTVTYGCIQYLMYATEISDLNLFLNTEKQQRHTYNSTKTHTLKTRIVINMPKLVY